MKPDESTPLNDSRSATMKGGTIFSLYADLWKLLKPGMAGHGGAMVAAYLLSLAGIVATFSGPWFLAAILDQALPARNSLQFFQEAAGVLFSLAAYFICSLLKTYYLSALSEHLFLSLRIRLVSTLLKKAARFFSRHETGDLITRVSNDTEHLSQLVFDYVFAGLNGLTMIVLFVILMLTWEWRLGLYTTLTLPGYVLLLSLMQKPISRAAKTARARLSDQNDTMLDILSGVKEIRFYQQFIAANRRFSDMAGQFTKANVRSILIGEWSFNTIELFSRFITMAPFLIGGYWICTGRESITVGTLIAYNLYLTYIAYSLEVVNVGVTKLAQAGSLIQRIRELLD
ncbi:MAG: ABC transporter ATP-binding protein [Deltaproteobacteria bacterium]|nr:ABC transporter ATP-binding protein [Deltaproteobacteria bacterium]